MDIASEVVEEVSSDGIKALKDFAIDCGEVEGGSFNLYSIGRQGISSVP